MSHLTLVPAYGRDYKSKREVENDLLKGKDFTVAGYNSGGYIDLEGLSEATYTTANVRFGQLRKVCVVNVAKLREMQLAGIKEMPAPKKRTPKTPKLPAFDSPDMM